ncbi:uncharacterized protein [Aegilops tauschii subsp. strangulata]|uniref:uncharacterized protein n=1 Tax=Aegilops tauschii subsp. strangulata TaxID=200361 RepID=UPI003CC87244
MAEEDSAKRHCGQTSHQSSNLDVVHVPGQKREYTVTLTGVELHSKETLEVVCTSEPDKADEMISRIRRSACGSYPHIMGVDVEFTKDDEPLQMAAVLQIGVEGLCLSVPYDGKPYDSLADVAASVIHPFYRKMKKKIDREADHKLWGDSPLPNYLIEYATIDAYATYKSWKIIDNIKRGLEISKEQEAGPYYHCHYAG